MLIDSVYISECIITNSWQQCPIPSDMQLQASLNPRLDYYDWIIFDDGCTGAGIATTLEALHHEVNPIWILPGVAFKRLSADRFEICPEGMYAFSLYIYSIDLNRTILIL